MKNSGIKFLIAVSLLVLFSCQKTNMQGSQTVTIHVSEFKTNRPIDGADVALFDKGNFDFLTCGCYESDLLLQGKTDYKGDFTVSQDIFRKANMGISVGKVLYIGTSGDNTTTQFTLSAVEQLQLRLVKVNPYPGANIILLQYKGETDQVIGTGNDYLVFRPEMTDTTFALPAYGEQINTFTLTIKDSAGHTIASPSFQIPVSASDNSLKEITF
jgi:hypothetical protein